MRRRVVLLFIVIAAALWVATSSTVALALEQQPNYSSSTTPTIQQSPQNSATTTTSSSSGIQPTGVIGGVTIAWGFNANGQLGNDSTTDSHVPTAVNGLSSSEVKSVSAGSSHSLALKNDGTVWAWGDNHFGELGNNSTTESHVPVQVKDPSGTSVLQGATAVSAGGGHSLALKSDGTVWAWGFNVQGELGNNTTPTDSPYAVPVSNLSGVTAIAAGGSHNLALKTDGTVWTWGFNSNGQLGNGTTGGGVAATA